MDTDVTDLNNSFASNCELRDEVSEVKSDILSDEKVDTDILSDEKEITSSEEESSTQLCSLSSGQRKHMRSFQRHPSVDEWLLGLPINTTPVNVHHEEVEDVAQNLDKDIQIDNLIGMGLQNDELFFQSYDVKKTALERFAYDKEKSDKDEEHDDEKDGEEQNYDEEENNGRGLQNDELFFQVYNVKETVSKKSAQNSSKKDNINLSKPFSSHSNDKEKEDADKKESDKEEECDDEKDEELEMGSSLNILTSLSGDSPDSGEVLKSFKQVNAETFGESDKESFQMRNQETDGNIVSDIKVLINFEQESNAEQSIDLENSQAPQLRETGEICALPNISETRINAEESEACTYVNEIKYEILQESTFENKESIKPQLSNEYSDETTKLIHENNESALPCTLLSNENISSNDKSLKMVESPDVFSYLEVEKPVYRRSKSLKTCKTPRGNQSCPKLVRFADILGLDLAETRVFADEIPRVPKAAFVDLAVEHIDNCSASNKANILPKTLIPQPKQLVPIFPQPGSLVQFQDLVRCQKICLESARMTGLTTLTGDVKVLNISFNKDISVLWTADNWVTKMVTMCDFVPGSSDGVTDKFRFHLDTAGLAEGSRVHLCLRYQTGEQEFWDNNGGENYVFRVAEKTQDQRLVENFLS